MKNYTNLGLSFLAGAVSFLCIWLIFGSAKSKANPEGRIHLHEITEIKELHLVKHRYTDLFFLHKKNNPEKPIVAIVQIPVTITAYVDLRGIIISENFKEETLVLIPKAKVGQPTYEIEKMSIRETGNFSVQVGTRHYPLVVESIQDQINQRKDSLVRIAVANKIIEQTETGAKSWIENFLKSAGHKNVTVKISGNK
ncbi:MAG: DUF4230 domain-containing protein [Bacteroidetes bacterium]|nr:DUF4230 domain-containing protein [Bacteroidota bacterium]